MGAWSELGGAMDLEGYVRRLLAAGVPDDAVAAGLARPVAERHGVPAE